jgi:hypothetical protein
MCRRFERQYGAYRRPDGYFNEHAEAIASFAIPLVRERSRSRVI